MTDLSGEAFQASEVAALYIHRPPYAEQIYQAIAAQAPATRRLLDLGCGEGKIARPLAQVFDQITAVDPSAPMIALGKTLENGQAANIDWVQAKAEEAPLSGLFDAVTFASSIHWMDPGALFEKLRPHLKPDHFLAVVEGDTPFDPPWEAAWQKFLAFWVPEVTGRPLGSDEWRASRTNYLDHVDVDQTWDFVSEPFEQTVEGFVLCQHSRATFNTRALGARLGAFRSQLEDVLHPYANQDGVLSYRVKTRLTLATLKGD